jgi:hypothetical protein
MNVQRQGRTSALLGLGMSELAAWDSFYVIVGSAAGALIGLQFVVVTLLAQKPSTPVPEATAAFGTPTVVHLGAALRLSALARVPWPGIVFPALLWGLIGLGGVIYAAIVIRRMRAQAAYIPEFEDWLFHIVLPVAAYVLLALSALAAPGFTGEALFGVAAAALLFLFISIHNAWDAVVYHAVSKKRPD